MDPSDNNNILGVISLPRTQHTAPFQPRWRQSSLDVQHSVKIFVNLVFQVKQIMVTGDFEKSEPTKGWSRR